MRTSVPYALAGLLLGSLLVATPAAADPAHQAASRQLEKIIEEHNDLRENLAETNRQRAALSRELAPLERAAATAQRRVAAIATGEYKTGRATAYATVLSEQGPRHVIDRLLVLERIGRQHNQTVTRLRVARERYESARRSLDALAAQQRDQEKRLLAQKSRIEADIARLESLPGAVRRPVDRSFVPPFVAGAAGAAVRFALAQLGKPYRYSASGPRAYDCSGLTSAAWARAGVRLPHNAARQAAATTPVPRAALRPGDLVFYYGDIHHVALYVGQGRMVHAPQHGQTVRVDRVDSLPVHSFGRPS